MKGIKVPFNPLNKYGEEPCCCQKGYYTKFGASTLYCVCCNLLCWRRRKKINSFCRANGWDKTCATCQQKGDYKLFGEQDKKEQ